MFYGHISKMNRVYLLRQIRTFYLDHLLDFWNEINFPNKKYSVIKFHTEIIANLIAEAYLCNF